MKISSHVGRTQVSGTRGKPQPRRAGSPEVERDLCDVEVIHLDAVRQAKAALPRNEAVARVVGLLGLLTNPTRLKILLALRPRGTKRLDELCVCDLAVVSGASKSMTSHQLRLLRAAGLVTVRRAGKLAYYRLADGPAAGLLGEALKVVSAGGGVVTRANEPGGRSGT